MDNQTLEQLIVVSPGRNHRISSKYMTRPERSLLQDAFMKSTKIAKNIQSQMTKNLVHSIHCHASSLSLLLYCVFICSGTRLHGVFNRKCIRSAKHWNHTQISCRFRNTSHAAPTPNTDFRKRICRAYATCQMMCHSEKWKIQRAHTTFR